jgi:hypothetical protein
MDEVLAGTVPISVDPRSRSDATHGPTLAAGADEAEADTAEPVAAELGHVSPDPDGDDAASVEHERLARLRRWQAER